MAPKCMSRPLKSVLDYSVHGLNPHLDAQKNLQGTKKELLVCAKDRNKYESEAIRKLLEECKYLVSAAEEVLESYKDANDHSAIKALKRNMSNITSRMRGVISSLQIDDSEEMKKHVKRLVRRMTSEEEQHLVVSICGTGGLSSLQIDDSEEMKEYFVGRRKDVKRLVRLMTSEEEQHRVVSICGTRGLGKTTLAKKTYRHSDIRSCFQSFAWVCLTKKPQANKVLRDILGQLERPPPQTNGEREEDQTLEITEYFDLFDKIYRLMRKKKCLVVLDEICQEDWENLHVAFPIIEAANSKILLTTQSEYVAEKDRRYLYELAVLPENHAWQLLQQVASPNNGAQAAGSRNDESELEALGKEIVHRCGYLPLEITRIGRALKSKTSLTEWRKINNDIGRCEEFRVRIEKHKRRLQLLDADYDLFSPYLKPLFLDFAIDDDEENDDHEVIDIEGLYYTRIAEVMCSSTDDQETEEESMKFDAIGHYLEEVASRCAVPMNMDYFVKPKEHMDYFVKLKKDLKFHLQDHIRELYLIKGEKKFNWIETKDFRSGNGCDASLRHDTRRLHIYLDEQVEPGALAFKRGRGTYSLRTLVCLNKSSNLLKVPSFVSEFKEFKLLRVLKINGLDFPSDEPLEWIGKLIKLTFLSLRNCKLYEVPKSMSRLRGLQTLDLRLKEDPHKIPDVFSEMTCLEHLYIPFRRKFTGLSLPNLQSLEFTAFSLDSLNTFAMNQKCQTCLRVVGCEFTIQGFEANPSSIRITNLRLVGCKFVEGGETMELLGSLPSLRCLYFQRNIITGNKLICHANGFPRLRYLRFQSLSNLREWTIEEGSMPNLCSLCIWDCDRLEMIPDGLRFITTLKELQIHGVSQRLWSRIQGEDSHKISHVPFLHV